MPACRMGWIEGVVWALAVFFAATWTLGLLAQPRFRVASTVAGVACWWGYMGVAALGWLNPLHLAWLMPGVMLVSQVLMQAELQASLQVKWVFPKTVAAAIIFGGVAVGIS